MGHHVVGQEDLCRRCVQEEQTVRHFGIATAVVDLGALYEQPVLKLLPYTRESRCIASFPIAVDQRLPQHLNRTWLPVRASCNGFFNPPKATDARACYLLWYSC